MFLVRVSVPTVYVSNLTLFHNYIFFCFKSTGFKATTNQIKLECLRRNGPHDPLPPTPPVPVAEKEEVYKPGHGKKKKKVIQKTTRRNKPKGETIQTTLAKVIERTYETIMMRILPSFTQINTVIEIRTHVLHVLMELSNATPKEIEEEVEMEEEEKQKEEEEENKQTEEGDEKEDETPPPPRSPPRTKTITVVPPNSLLIDATTSEMLDEFNKRLQKEMSRLTLRLPTLPVWTEEEKNSMSKQKQKKAIKMAKIEMQSKTAIALKRTIEKLKHIEDQSNLLRKTTILLVVGE